MATPLTPPINPIIRIAPLVSAAEHHVAAPPPQPLAGLPQGSTLTGFIITRDAQNNPILRTELGDLQLTSELFLKTGAQLMIRVDGSQTSRARIVSIDGIPLEDYADYLPRPLTEDTIETTAMIPVAGRMQGPIAGNVSVQAPLLAMLLQSPQLPLPSAMQHPLFSILLGNSLPPMLAQMPEGTPLQVTILAIATTEDLSSPSAATLPPSPLPNAFSSASPAIYPHPSDVAPPHGNPLISPASSNTATSSLAAQDTASPLRVSLSPLAPHPAPSSSYHPRVIELPSHPNLTAPNSVMLIAAQGIPDFSDLPPPAFSSPSTGQSSVLPPPALPSHPSAVSAASAASTLPFTEGIPAIVIGHEGEDGLILQSRVGMLKLFTPHPLPIGTPLALAITPASPPPAATSQRSVLPPETSISPLSSHWEHLEKAIESLPKRPHSTIPPELERVLPQIASSRFTSDVLFFLQAIQRGNAPSWLGASVLEKIERKQAGLGRQITADFGQMEQLLLHSPIPHWSGVLIPMHWDGQLEYARLYLREDTENSPEKDSRQPRNPVQRFVMDLQLSHLGPLQLDGWVQSGQPKQFDLILRSHTPLPATLSEEIRTVFDQALHSTGLKGYVTFQHGSQHFIRPLADLPAPPLSGEGAGPAILA